MGKRIGPRMREVVAYVDAHPGCPILPVAEHVGPHGSRQFGYRTVHRCIDAGLVEHVPQDGHAGERYALFLTPAGEALLDRTSEVF